MTYIIDNTRRSACRISWKVDGVTRQKNWSALHMGKNRPLKGEHLGTKHQQLIFAQQHAIKTKRIAIGRPSYGYTTHEKRWEIDPIPASKVLGLYATFAYGFLSPEVYARFSLEEIGAITHRTAKSAERILKNRVYTGEYAWGGELYRYHHPAIVPYALFNVVQEAMHPVAMYAKGAQKYNRKVILASTYPKMVSKAHTWLCYPASHMPAHMLAEESIWEYFSLPGKKDGNYA